MIKLYSPYAFLSKYLGAIFLSFFCYYAKEIGCNNLTLSVWNDNEGALRFYQRQGMKPQETTMEIIID
ncbi:GNAT family N-acetyltransferase [Streptococcus pneumoniae]|nr:GNAT family N-acetyltransferase [Streptococcus pneumoniae]MDG7122828.1 GNAT family N-acetyltransferase [Streptococcus pneumoniae]MDG7162726.1 GNAT family N-acetyltransferase [Streptococcus pneumoniae]MDG7244177.1 GNAT family N-acetyltransferase [Streptococcus pneumoniae]MDG7635183.1 GNAT family N-acetyltransferase [Streptococcus pneumoniae]